MVYDGVPVLAILRSDDSHQHLALMTDESPDDVTYLLALIDDADAAGPITTSRQLRELVLASTRTARLILPFGERGRGCETEVLVPVDQLSEDEIPQG